MGQKYLETPTQDRLLQLLYNRKLNKNNKSGVKGVCWEPSHNAWKANIKVNKKMILLGRFKRLPDAAAAIFAARIKHHGEFARAA